MPMRRRGRRRGGTTGGATPSVSGQAAAPAAALKVVLPHQRCPPLPAALNALLTLRPPCAAGPRSKKASTSAAAAAAAAAVAPKRSKKQKAGAGAVPQRALCLVKQDAAWLAAQQARPGFLTADISGGVEARQIPAFNEVDDEPLPAGLVYVR